MFCGTNESNEDECGVTLCKFGMTMHHFCMVSEQIPASYPAGVRVDSALFVVVSWMVIGKFLPHCAALDTRPGKVGVSCDIY